MDTARFHKAKIQKDHIVMPHVMVAYSPYYKDVSELLTAGVKACLDAEGATYEFFPVSGALELPLAIKLGAVRHESTEHQKFDAFIALGCVIRGETTHYDIVCGESARGLADLALQYDLAIGNGILTCESKEQALHRADPAQKNKGREFVDAALSLYKLKKEFGIA